VNRYTDDQLRQIALDRDGEHFAAHVIATLYKSGRSAAADRLFAAIGHSPRMHELVGKKWKGKRTKSDLTPTGIEIVRAWFAATERCGMISYESEREMTLHLNAISPTLHEVKMEYAKLFVKEQRPTDKTARAWLVGLEGENKIPRDRTFRKTLNLCECEFTLEKPRTA